MLTKEQARIGAKVAIPTQKTAGCDFEYFAAELAGCELQWDSVAQNVRRVPHRNARRRKPYQLAYLVISQVSAFADSPNTCVVLRRADKVAWLGAHTFADEDLVVYKG